MIVTQLKPGVLIAPEADHRPSGLHVSDIIKDLLVTLKPQVYGKPMDMNKIQTGMAFEEVLERSFYAGKSGIFRPDPIFVTVPTADNTVIPGGPQGIWLSPDGFDPELLAVQEFKLTWYSMNKECPYDEVYWPWLVQIKAYCFALDVLLAVLWVMYINGDYKPPKPRPPLVFGLEFSQIEILENWSMLVNHARTRGWLL